ncbi:MAG: GNAT family N-acetyltransferase [Lachnospiraceae bacterium]|nr:GNAT family N-acetyltransferase [Lachnospiraceae bacterium]
MSESIKIRPVEIKDCEEILSIYQPFILNSSVTFEYEVPSLQVFTERVLDIQKSYPYYVAEKNNHIIGYCYAHKFRERNAFDWICETSIYISNDSIGKGLGHQLYDTLSNSLIEMGIHRMYACITSPNPNSIFFHKNYGFQELGIFPHAGFKLGEWHDVTFLEKILIEDCGNPLPIKTWGDLRTRKRK